MNLGILHKSNSSQRKWSFFIFDFISDINIYIIMKDLLIHFCNQIPKGQVASFWDIATQINIIYTINWENAQSSWRLVWRFLSNMNIKERPNLPRQRVVNNKWFVSSLKLWAKWILQIQLLRQEWVTVSDEWILDISKYRFTNWQL